MLPFIAAVVLAVGLTVGGVDPAKVIRTVTQDSPASALLGSGGSGGTLVLRSQGPMLALDPQRIATREAAGFASRVYARTLTAYTPDSDGGKLVGDLATDTGTPNKKLTEWSFTLRSGVRWQDGSPVTCEDVAYGVSRSFAPQISGGPSYALAYLAVPKKTDGSTTYPGPYAKGSSAKKGQKAFDKAVSCKDNTITFKLSEPVADFPDMVSLPAFAPFKKSADRGEDSLYRPFSNGPYQLSSAWKPGKGGTWVRNTAWDADSDPIRKALPDVIDYREGEEPQVAAEEIMRDQGDGVRSVSLDSAPPALVQQLGSIGDLDSRAVNPRSQLIDYLAPNLNSKVFTKLGARRALALATDRGAYVKALGGGRAAVASYSLLCPILSEHSRDDALGSGPGGDPSAARAALKKAGFSLPVKIRVAYRSSPTSDTAVKALAATWEKAGFTVVPKPVDDDYFSTVSKKGAADAYDVFWANWAADWPSASTVFPPLFDSRINLTKNGAGRDYGYVDDDKLNTMMTKASRTRDASKRAKAWDTVDHRLLEQGDYIPLAQRRSLFVAGSDVTNLQTSAVYGGAIDLAVIGVR